MASVQSAEAIGTQAASSMRSARRSGVRIKQMLNYANMSKNITRRHIGLAELLAWNTLKNMTAYGSTPVPIAMPDFLGLENQMEQDDQAEYKICKCPQCDGKLCVAEYTSTVQMRIDGKLHPVGVRRVPCHKCDSCDWATMGSESDEYFMHYYQKYLNEKGLNTWRHRAWRYVKRQWRLWETMFYRGPMWQWRRERNS